jgi:predicted phage terminase large subunit-like protein
MPALPSVAELQAERARRSLREFVGQMWPLVVPGEQFVPGFHIDAICEHLEAVTRGEIRRLIISVPPRHGKSLLTSVFWPAWSWLSRPELRWLYASYGQHLSSRDSVFTRRLIEDPRYRGPRGPGFSLTGDVNLKDRFENDRGGMRLATSVGGSATGEGGDILVIDDVHKIDEGQSRAALQRAIEWYEHTLVTRLNDPKTGVIVIIGQRLHEGDLIGHLLSQGGFEHLCLPAEYDPAHPYLWEGDPRTVPGELLWPQRYDLESLERLKRSLGSYAVASQLQQMPAPATGGIFKRGWWRWYPPGPPWPAFERIIQSWDLSFVGTPGADYTVGQVWGKIGPDRYLIHQVHERMGFTETIAAIHELTDWVGTAFPEHTSHSVLIERAANGDATIDVLRKEIPSVLPIRPKGDKLHRAHAVSPQIEAGNVYLPGQAPSGPRSPLTLPWVGAFIDEAAAFPNAANDDQVDAMTQALLKLKTNGPQLRALHWGPVRR